MYCMEYVPTFGSLIGVNVAKYEPQSQPSFQIYEALGYDKNAMTYGLFLIFPCRGPCTGREGKTWA